MTDQSKTETDQRRKPAGVGAAVASGSAISSLGVLMVRLLGILSIAVLGRLLSPEDFGILAMAMIIVGLVEAGLNQQFEMALVRLKTPTKEDFDTAFTIGLGLGVSMGIAIFVSAGAFANFFEAPHLKLVLQYLALAPVMVGLRNPYFVTYEINLNFLPRVLNAVVSRTAMTFSTIGIAVVTGDYWALVLGTLVMYLTATVLTWTHRHGRPGLSLSRWRPFVRFGGWLTGSGISDFLAYRVPAAFLGSVSGTYLAGVFQVGSEVATTMTKQVVTPLTQPFYAGLSKFSDEPEKMKRGYFLAQQGILGIALPVGFGLALVAPELLRVLLGTQWDGAVPVIRFLAPATALQTLAVGVVAVVLVHGDTRALFLRNLTVLCFLLPGLWIGYQYWGLAGLIAAKALSLILHLGLSLQVAARLTQSGFWDALVVGRRSVLAVLGMSGALLALDAVWGVENAFELDLGAAIALLTVKVSLGAAVYGILQVGLWMAEGRPNGFEAQLMQLLGRLAGKITKRAG